MKSTSGWLSPNAGATNSSGFNAIPSGSRSTTSHWGLDKAGATYWSSSPYDPLPEHSVWVESLWYEDAEMVRFKGEKVEGHACRCVKDK